MRSITGRTGFYVLLLLVAAAPLSHASMSIYMEPEALARRASLVVEGTVVGSASGYDPADGSLSTYVTLQVETLHRGTLDVPTLVLREPGGRFGELVHHVDAVPLYTPGERVLVFLETAADGALRTAGMFFGKYRLDDRPGRGARRARRELDGQGLIAGRPAASEEDLPLSDLIAVVSRVPRTRRSPRGGRGPAPLPPEFSRLVWDPSGPAPTPTAAVVPSSAKQPLELSSEGQAAELSSRFVPLSENYPTRWYEPDSGIPVSIRVDRSGNPLGDGEAAAAQMARALAAWSDVPESRLVLQMGDDDYDFVGTRAISPADQYSGINVILFDDPYDDISDPSGCSGVLAIGGYWRSSGTGPAVNGVTFHRALQLYVIFNNNFECYLGIPDNLSEVAAHELGHGIGFGHSFAPDAIMRSFAYGYRGPRLGDDDRDAAHCHYPHTLALLSPAGGESWEAGSVQAIEWTASPEQGADPGEVDLEYSVDGGSTWEPIAAAVANDGYLAWVVPDTPGTNARVRVARRQRAGFIPEIFPSTCSSASSAGSFSIVPPTLIAGAIPTEIAGGGLTLRAEPNGTLRLRWDASCSSDVETHAVYEGDLDALRAGRFVPARVTCDAGPDLVEYVVPRSGDRYYLVAPIAGGNEGSLGTDSDGQARPSPAVACAPREADSVCR